MKNYTKNVEVNKIWRIMGSIDACKESLERAIEAKDFETMRIIVKYLEKVNERLDKLTEE